MNLLEIVKNNKITMEEIISKITSIEIVDDSMIIKFGQESKKEDSIEKPNKNSINESRINNAFRASHSKHGTFYAKNQRVFTERFDLNQSAISRCLNGIQPKYKGWSFRYLEGDLKKEVEAKLSEGSYFLSVE